MVSMRGRMRTGYAVGMTPLDYASNPRIGAILELVRELSRATQPQEVLRIFSAGMARLNGPAGYISLSCRGLEPGQYRITRLLLDDNITDIHKTDSWTQPQLPPLHSGGLLGQIVAGECPVVLNDLDWRGDPVIGDAAAGYRSLIAQPIFDDGLAQNWSVLLRREPNFFSVDDIEEYLLRSNLVGGTVRHVQTARQLQQANDHIRAEIERIASIQRTLLPERLPEIPGLSMAASYETFDQAGGDFYLFHEMGRSAHAVSRPDGRWAVLVGDVSGHGPAAAVVMAMVQALFFSYADPSRDEHGFFEYLNSHLCAKRIDNTFVTAVAAVYDPGTRMLTYSCAGHPPPLLHRRGDPPSIASLHSVGNLPLGIIAGVDYPITQMQLSPGDTLVFYTDGITEARNSAGEFFGDQGLAESLMHCSGAPACVVDTIKSRLHAFQAGARPQDDQTLLILRVEG